MNDSIYYFSTPEQKRPAFCFISLTFYMIGRFEVHRVYDSCDILLRTYDGLA